jgi:hypothetical protein
MNDKLSKQDAFDIMISWAYDMSDENEQEMVNAIMDVAQALAPKKMKKFMKEFKEQVKNTPQLDLPLEGKVNGAPVLTVVRGGDGKLDS